MPSSLLWAVDVYGRVCSLSTTGGRWQPYKDVLLELKRVTGAERCCWGIGCDHQVYLNVSPREVSIRHQEETYENQRWNPVEGYTDTLLPTDRWQWTDETGLKPQPLHSFQLPSDNWEWEGDWFVDDESCGSESSRTGGWEYAVDFPVTFSKEKKWNSCVRRRRWLRYRRYKAQGTWAKVPLDKTRAPPEPFIDISCGGWEMGNPKQQLIFLWAVSQQGKVWFRAGIQQLNPEGRFWEQLQVPREVAQVAAGPGDLLWAVLWEGQLLARTGVSKNCPKGSSWEVVDPPNKTGVMNVAVGVNVVWAVTKDNKVWFRRGVNSHNVCGSGWISISGEMVMVSVGPHDQVWGVGSEDRTVYFRNGVTDTEVTGRSWIPVTAQWDRNQSTNQPSVSSDGCVFSGEVTGPSQGSVLGCTDADVPRPSIPKITSDSFISALVSDRPGPQGRPENAPHPAVPEGTPEEGEGEGSAPQTQSLAACQAGGSEPPWSNVDLEEVKSPPPRAVATYPMELVQSVEQEERPPWAWVSGGGCVLDLAQQISWLATSDAGPISPSITPALPAPAEGQAASRHTERHPEQAHETSVRLLKGRISWWRDWLPHQWEEVGVCLEQVSSSNGHRDDVLHIYYTQNEERKFLSTGMREVTALVPVLREGLQALAVYTAQRTRQRWPLLLSTQSEQHMMDWLSSLSGSCCDSRGLWGPPSKQALWSLTSKGDVMVHDPSPSLEAPGQHLPCDQMFWRQIPGHLLCVEANSLGVVWGISYNHTAWVYSGACRGRSSQDPNGDEANTLTDVRNVYVYENQRWNPVTGYTDKGLPTDRYMWSDECGLRQCTKESTQPPSPQWTWVSDWATDYSVPGGTDREGWQYAADFPVSYHGYKTIKDFVRRRRWARKCKITLTGPWLEVPPITLSDITILPCLSQSSMEQVPVWAISEKGDVLCRLGVTIQDPAGSSWLHVGTDQPFKSISIGGGHQVWAIARDGTVFYRGSVSAHNPAGECWYHIPSPLRQSLRQVSVGRTSVYAVDENSNLWYRQGLTPSYPQGSAWELICTNVSKVSVGPLDQVWTIAEKVPGSPAESPGTVCHRLGVRPMQPKGLTWDYGIGGGWQHLSVRGNSMEAQRGLPQSPLPTQRQINGTAGGS